jgi:hypothetical protein
VTGPLPYPSGPPAIYLEGELDRLYPEAWGDKARRKFRRDLASALAGLGPVLDADPSAVRAALQFAVRHRDLAEGLLRVARKYKHNIPRMTDEDVREAMDSARVRDVMEG